MASLVDACIFIPAAGGTVDFVVSAAKQGWRMPSGAGAVNGGTYYYRAYSDDQTEWEIGRGVYTVGTTTLTRAVITDSSNSGSKTAFTLPPNVALTAFSVQFPTDAQLAKIDWLTVTQAVDLDALEAKLAFISVTQAVNLDTMESDLATATTNIGINASAILALDGRVTTVEGQLSFGRTVLYSHMLR